MGQLAGGEPQAGLGRERPGTRSAGAAGGMGPLLAALLPVVLSMLAGSRGSQPQGRGGAGGGLGDVLAQVLGGAGAGAGGGSGGGLGALLEQLQRAGFGAEADSWVGRGANRPLPADALDRVFGRDALAQIAHRAGVSEQDAKRGLAEVLPEVVDRVTPDGRVPDDEKLLASVDDLARKLGLA
jgi:uncharacterized protein YidB (DUF937 family)